MSAALTVEQLIEQLAQLPQAARVLINNQSGLPFTYAVTGIVSAQQFDVAHLFDKEAAPPEADCVYLLIKIETA